MKKLIYLVPTLLGLFVFATVFNKVRLHYSWSEALRRTVMTPFTGTLWSEGFSEAHFSKVRIGMSSQEVRGLLGPPLQEWCASAGCAWLYSWQDTPTADYDERSIAFDTSWRVMSIMHRFYID